MFFVSCAGNLTVLDQDEGDHVTVRVLNEDSDFRLEDAVCSDDAQRLVRTQPPHWPPL